MEVEKAAFSVQNENILQHTVTRIAVPNSAK
jgi:hypothetical protein